MKERHNAPQKHKASWHKKKEWCDATQKQKALHCKNKSTASQKREAVTWCKTNKHHAMHKKSNTPWRKTFFCVVMLSLLLCGRHGSFKSRHSLFHFAVQRLVLRHSLFVFAAQCSSCNRQNAMSWSKKACCNVKEKLPRCGIAPCLKKDRESITMQIQRRSVTSQSHCHKAKVRVSQCSATTKRTTMQKKDCCIVALFVFASHRDTLTTRRDSFASRCSLKLPTKIAMLQSERESIMMQSSHTA